MDKSYALTSYMAKIVDIVQEAQAKMQRVKEIKAEMDILAQEGAPARAWDKLKKVDTKPKATTNNNKMTSAAHGASLCKDAGASLRMSTSSTS